MMVKMPSASTGSVYRNTAEMRGLMVMAMVVEKISVIGARTAMRRIIWKAFCTLLTSVVRRVTSEEELNISPRNISLSTCALVPKIYRFMEDAPHVTLSISLHAHSDEVRKTMMPIANVYPIADLIEAARAYAEKTGRRVVFEYALVEGVNDSRQDATALAMLVRGMLCHVNLIPVNKVSGTGFERPDRKNIERFAGLLDAQGVSVTVRRELGRDIDAACGQLRKQTAEERKAAEAAKTAGVAETVIEKPDNG